MNTGYRIISEKFGDQEDLKQLEQNMQNYQVRLLPESHTFECTSHVRMNQLVNELIDEIIQMFALAHN